jgi:hypothetical protein
MLVNLHLIELLGRSCRRPSVGNGGRRLAENTWASGRAGATNAWLRSEGTCLLRTEVGDSGPGQRKNRCSLVHHHEKSPPIWMSSSCIAASPDGSNRWLANLKILIEAPRPAGKNQFQEQADRHICREREDPAEEKEAPPLDRKNRAEKKSTVRH